MTDHYDPLGRDDHHGDPADPGPTPDPTEAAVRTAVGDEAFDRAVLLDLGGLAMSEQQYRRLEQFVDDHPGHDLRADVPSRAIHCYTCTHSITLHEDGGWSAEAGTAVEDALASLTQAMKVGTVTTPAEVMTWLGDRGCTIRLAGWDDVAPDRPEVSGEAVEALADRLPFDEHLNRVARATELLGQLAIDGWHLERDRTEADVAVEAHPGWQEREDRREAMGLALELVKAGSIGVDDLLVRSQLIQAYLSGRVELVVPAVPIVMLTEAVEALERYAQEKARSTSFHENGAQLLLLGEGLAHALKALVDHLQDDES